MTQKFVFLSLILSLCMYIVHAEDSPFDVLSESDRYKSEASEMFDVNEGDETSQENNTSSSSRVFDVTHEEPEYTGTYYNKAKIVALNKITAKSQELTMKVGDTTYFGNIAISVHKCWSNNNLYAPESKILVKVIESRIDEDPHDIFSGWLISGNIPASVLEHPSYELLAIGCMNDKK